MSNLVNCLKLGRNASLEPMPNIEDNEETVHLEKYSISKY